MESPQILIALSVGGVSIAVQVFTINIYVANTLSSSINIIMRLLTILYVNLTLQIPLVVLQTLRNPHFKLQRIYVIKLKPYF